MATHQSKTRARAARRPGGRRARPERFAVWTLPALLLATGCPTDDGPGPGDEPTPDATPDPTPGAGDCVADHACATVWGTAPAAGRLYVDASAEAGGDGSCEEPFATLYAALGAIGAQTSVVLAPGEYTGSWTLVTPDLEIAGCGRDETTLVGLSDSAPVVHVGGGGDAVVLRDLAVRGGRDAITIDGGAGDAAGPVSVLRVSIAQPVGSGILVAGEETVAAIEETSIAGPVPFEGLGMGVVVHMETAPLAPTTLTNVDVTGATGLGLVGCGGWLDISGGNVSGTQPTGAGARGVGELGRGVQLDAGTIGTIDGLVVDGNTDAGIFVANPGCAEGGLEIRDTTVTGTVAGVAVSGAATGDGLVVAGTGEGTCVSVVESAFSGNVRAHILASGPNLGVDGVTTFDDAATYDVVEQNGSAVDGAEGGDITELGDGDELDLGTVEVALGSENPAVASLPCVEGSDLYDAWEVELTAGTPVQFTVDTRTAAGAFDPSASLYQGAYPDASIFVEDADDSIPCTFPPPEFECPQFTVTPAVSGTFWLVVAAASECDAGPGEYSLTSDPPLTFTSVSDDEPAAWFADVDQDGWSEEDDCDDDDPAINPGAAELCDDGVDNNCDGISVVQGDVDGDGVTACGGNGQAGDPTDDCDDFNSTVGPGAIELCDSLDNDCDGSVDEDYDVDADGSTTCDGDCDDGDAAISPEATEQCDNGVDEDCSGADLLDVDADGDGATTCGGNGVPGDPTDDCADWDPNNFPGNTEVCDGEDNDCDDDYDEGFDSDGDGWPSCDGDCDDSNPAIQPGAMEICDDGLDQDCDELDTLDVDIDGDGFTTCGGNGVAGEPGDDCNDSDATVNPGALEACDGMDTDCDGDYDEGFDQDNDGYTTCDGDCDDLDAGRHPFAFELCGDGIDQDCAAGDLVDADVDGDGVLTCGPNGVNGDPTDDCDDTNIAVFPGAVEVCDGFDTDCDGATYVSGGDEYDFDGDGWVSCDGYVDNGAGFEGGDDCDEGFGPPGPLAPSAIHPYAGDAAVDGIDEDCDGLDCLAGEDAVAGAPWTGAGPYFVYCATILDRAAASAACTADTGAGDVAHVALATIASPTEQTALSALASAGPDPWIGCTDAGAEGVWGWDNAAFPACPPVVSGGPYCAWDFQSSEPNGSTGENCAVLDSSVPGWDDRVCGNATSFGFLCETR